MINLNKLDLDILELKKIGKNKIPNYKNLERLQLLYKNYKKQQRTLEDLKSQHNKQSATMAKKILQKAPLTEINNFKILIKKNKTVIVDLESQVKAIYQELINELLYIPNFPDASVPEGEDTTGDIVIDYRGKVLQNKPLDHITIGEQLNILNWKNTVEMSGTRFVSYTNLGAKLKRALINFMLDNNSNLGYEEISTPYLVNHSAMQGTGQLPKFSNDMYKIKNKDLYLIPTSEVSLTNFYRNFIFSENQLPIKLTQYSPCFRKEAGAAGKDNNGTIRLHQFDKVEIVQLCKPEDSNNCLEQMVQVASDILTKLELPHRIIELCTGSLGFSSSKTFDIEVWMPSQNKYREISSCSNCKDFQSRRINLKYRKNKKNVLLHTLNGSALAIDRLIAALLENHQTNEGFVAIPKILRPYLNGLECIKF